MTHFCEYADGFPGDSAPVGTRWTCPGCDRSYVYAMGMSEEGHYGPHWYATRPPGSPGSPGSSGPVTSVLVGAGEPVPVAAPRLALGLLAALVVVAAWAFAVAVR